MTQVKVKGIHHIAIKAKGLEEFYAKFGDRMPAEMTAQLNALKDRLSK